MNDLNRREQISSIDAAHLRNVTHIQDIRKLVTAAAIHLPQDFNLRRNIFRHWLPAECVQRLNLFLVKLHQLVTIPFLSRIGGRNRAFANASERTSERL